MMQENLTVQEAAWLAGYIDGDGSVCLNKSTQATRRPILIIDSCDSEILRYVISIAGGSLVAKKKYKDHHRQTWTWRLTGAKQVINLLAQLTPYLRCDFKRMRAEMLVAEWQDTSKRNGCYTPENVKKKLEFEERFLAIGAGRGSRSQLKNTVTSLIARLN